MGLLPFAILYAAKKKQDEASARAARARREAAKKAQHKSDNYSGYRYHQPDPVYSLELSEIEDTQAREFVEGFFAYRQEKIDSRNAELQKAIDEAEAKLPKQIEESKKYASRSDKAAEVYRKCMGKVEGRRELIQSHNISYYDRKNGNILPSTEILDRIERNPVYHQVQDFARGNRILTQSFDIDAIRGVKLENSNYYKTLIEGKREFYQSLSQMEVNLMAAKKQLVRTLRPSKRSELKSEIQSLTSKISREKEFAPTFERIIKAYCDFYSSVENVEGSELEILTTASEDSTTGRAAQAHRTARDTEENIRSMKREVESPDLDEYNKGIIDYTLSHPEYTEDVLNSIEQSLRDSEEKKRDALCAETKSYSYKKIQIDGKMEPYELYRLIDKAISAVAHNESENY